MDTNFASAYRLMTSTKAREAFDLTKEPIKVRERYGMTRFGQSCLLARRLVEAGVRFVTINTFITVFDEITWDIHGSKPFTSIAGMKDLVAPMYDQGYSALIEDWRTRPAGQHDGLQPRGIWPHAKDQSGGRTGSLAAMLDGLFRRRRRQRREDRWEER